MLDKKIEKKDVIKLYNLPTEIRFCKKCVMSNQRPRITFNEEGVCSACDYVENRRNKIDWEAREKELLELLDRHRRNDGGFDIIVPSSGGKDSTFVAWNMKYKYNMNPLTVTWAPHIYTDVGWHNFQALINAGLPNILISPDKIALRRLTRRCFVEMGEPFQPFIYGQVLLPFQIALKYGIKLIMGGENAELEYGGDKNASAKQRFTSSTEEVLKYAFSNVGVERWLEDGFTKKDLAFYFAVSSDELLAGKIEHHCFSYYKKWLPQENYYFATEKTGFKANPERSEGTYAKYASLDDKIDGFHFYMMFVKFGIGRATSDAAHEVRDGHITRNEAVGLVRKYDGEFPEKYFKVFLEYCDLTEEEFWQAVDSWRSDHIWKKENGMWKLRRQVDYLKVGEKVSV